jgi:hypothetical protein
MVLNWTSVSGTIYSRYGYDVSYGNGRWVAIGSGGNTILYSNDGNTILTSIDGITRKFLMEFNLIRQE